MKVKKLKRSVTTELFCIYFFGYIAITIILIVGIIFSIVGYEFLCNPSTYNSYFIERVIRDSNGKDLILRRDITDGRSNSSMYYATGKQYYAVLSMKKQIYILII